MPPAVFHPNIISLLLFFLLEPSEQDREILRDQWKWALENRDLRIEQYRADQAKQGK